MYTKVPAGLVSTHCTLENIYMYVIYRYSISSCIGGTSTKSSEFKCT